MGHKARRRRYQGKSLLTLLRYLPGNGVGRLIARGSELQVEGEPTYMRILEVDMTPLKSKTKCEWKMKRICISKCMVQKTFRGVTIPRLGNLNLISYLPDFLLIPKEEEHKYLGNTKTASEKGYLLSKDDEDENVSADSQQLDGEYGDCETSVELNTEVLPQRTKAQQNKRPINKPKNKIKRILNEKQPNKTTLCEVEFGNFSEDQMHRINIMINEGMNSDTAKQIEWERCMALKLASESELNEAEGRA